MARRAALLVVNSLDTACFLLAPCPPGHSGSARPWDVLRQSLESEAAGDDLPLHLRGAGVERARERVAHLALDRVLLHVAIAAEQLQRVQRGPYVGLAHEQLGDRRLQHRAPALLLEPAHAVEEE